MLNADLSLKGVGWSGWAVRGSAWGKTDLNGEKDCRCADPTLFL